MQDQWDSRIPHQVFLSKDYRLNVTIRQSHSPDFPSVCWAYIVKQIISTESESLGFLHLLHENVKSGDGWCTNNIENICNFVIVFFTDFKGTVFRKIGAEAEKVWSRTREESPFRIDCIAKDTILCSMIISVFERNVYLYLRRLNE
jgi:hypothetical protein